MEFSQPQHWYYLGVWKYGLSERHGQMLLPQLSLEGAWCYEMFNVLSASNKSEIKKAPCLPHLSRTYNLNYSAVEVEPVSHKHSSLGRSRGCRRKLPPASEAAPVFWHMRIASSNGEGYRVRVEAFKEVWELWRVSYTKTTCIEIFNFFNSCAKGAAN